MVQQHHSKSCNTRQVENSATDPASSFNETYGDWQIQKDILYLDNGAFGACPASVAKTQKELRQWIEQNPHDFFERSYVKSLETSKGSLARFLHANPRDLTLLPGATHGLNVVIQSLKFNRDDEILTTNVAYSSVRMVLEHVAKRDGAHVVVVEVPLLVDGPEDVLQRILAGVTPHTRFAVIDHVPSRTGLVLPAKEIVRELDSRGIDTLVDGAHAPGMIPLDVEDINAAYYVANCHKWMCAPRGVGFLHVRHDRAQNIKPLIIARSPYVVGKAEHSSLEHSFGWMGTYCPTAMLSLPAAIDHLETVVPGGYSGLINRNHDLAVLARKIVCKAIGVSTPCPDTMIGAMATIPLPDSPGPEQEGMLPIQQKLWEEHDIVIPVYSWPAFPKRVIRLSVQAYNSLDQYLKLADCLRMVLHSERNTAPQPLKDNSLLWSMTEERRPSNDSAYSSSSDLSITCGCSGNDTESQSTEVVKLGTPSQGIEGPTPSQLLGLAQSRLRRIATGGFASYPLAIFPTAKDTETQILSAGESKYQHINLEASRMKYMLSSLARRRIPALMAPFVNELLEAEDVIASWPNLVESLKDQAQILSRSIVFDMIAPRTPAKYPNNAKDFVNRALPYETESCDENISLTFWYRALHDFTTASPSSPARVTAFLQIHSFLKDPVGGLSGDFEKQAGLFQFLLNGLTEFNFDRLGRRRWEEMIAQLALESSFLSQPLVSKASYVHFEEDQQLVFSYVDMFSLARSEFACPEIVVRMINKILDSDNDKCCIAPIAVSHFEPICSDQGTRTVVVDGNNRTTTLIFLRFVATYGLSNLERIEKI
ncbi:hypothetical protein ACHAPI_011147 [Fusarium lateritium]